MKKLLFVIIGTVILAILVYAAGETIEAPTDFTMVYGTNPHTDIRITFSHNFDADTLTIVNADADSTIEVTLSDDYAYGSSYDTTISGLQPGRLYSWAVRADSGDGIKCASNGDTLTLPRVEIWSDSDLGILGRTLFDPAREMKLATSFRSIRDSTATARIDTSLFIVTGATAAESTIVYEPWAYNSIDGVAIGHDDSTKLGIHIYAGYFGQDFDKYDGAQNTLVLLPFWTLVDSIIITDPGSFSSGLLNIPPSAHMMVIIHGYTDNVGTPSSDSTGVYLRLNRAR